MGSGSSSGVVKTQPSAGSVHHKDRSAAYGAQHSGTSSKRARCDTPDTLDEQHKESADVICTNVKDDALTSLAFSVLHEPSTSTRLQSSQTLGVPRDDNGASGSTNSALSGDSDQADAAIASCSKAGTASQHKQRAQSPHSAGTAGGVGTLPHQPSSKAGQPSNSSVMPPSLIPPVWLAPALVEWAGMWSCGQMC